MINRKFCELIGCGYVKVGCCLGDGWKCIDGGVFNSDWNLGFLVCFYFKRMEPEVIDTEFLDRYIDGEEYREDIQIIAALVKSKKKMLSGKK